MREVEESYGSGYYLPSIFRQLVEFGNRVVPDLIKMLESEHERIRSDASQTLEQIGTPEALKELQEEGKT